LVSLVKKIICDSEYLNEGSRSGVDNYLNHYKN